MGGLCEGMSHEAGKGIGVGASQYFDKDVSETIQKAQKTLTSVDGNLDSSQQLLDWGKWCLACSSVVGNITGAVYTACRAYETIAGAKAQQHLERLGATISSDLKEMNDSMDTSIALQEPTKLSKHIHKFARSRINACRDEGNVQDLFFVYHPGSNWWPEFDALQKEDPLPEGLCGKTHKIEALGAALMLVRKVVGDHRTIHILVPSAHMYIVPETIRIPAQLGPISIEGELNRKGEKFVYVTMPKEHSCTLIHVGLIRIVPREDGKCSSSGGFLKELAAGAAGVGAGMGGSIAGGTGGAFIGAPVVGAVAGATSAGWAAAEKVKDDW